MKHCDSILFYLVEKCNQIFKVYYYLVNNCLLRELSSWYMQMSKSIGSVRIPNYSRWNNKIIRYKKIHSFVQHSKGSISSKGKWSVHHIIWSKEVTFLIQMQNAYSYCRWNLPGQNVQWKDHISSGAERYLSVSHYSSDTNILDFN